MKNGKEIDSMGTVWYYKNNTLHREDGPAIEFTSGTKAWYINDKLHREDGPAIECANGSKFWYINDKRHREDGPAIEYTNGYEEWYINGICVSMEEVLNTPEKLENYMLNETLKSI